MKKLMFIFGITLVLASCSNQPAETAVPTTDSTAVAIDTVAPVAADTTAVVDSPAK
jgi:PBP1b-binding outer membrane lipoprotein LpoB